MPTGSIWDVLAIPGNKAAIVLHGCLVYYLQQLPHCTVLGEELLRLHILHTEHTFESLQAASGTTLPSVLTEVAFNILIGQSQTTKIGRVGLRYHMWPCQQIKSAQDIPSGKARTNRYPQCPDAASGPQYSASDEQTRLTCISTADSAHSC